MYFFNPQNISGTVDSTSSGKKRMAHNLQKTSTVRGLASLSKTSSLVQPEARTSGRTVIKGVQRVAHIPPVV